jgi:hypothetical protein
LASITQWAAPVCYGRQEDMQFLLVHPQFSGIAGLNR